MEAVILTKEQFQDLVKSIEEIKSEVKLKQKNSKDIFLDNQEFIQLMHISKRTAQFWRDAGIISFSQVGNKVYYRMSDIEQLLETNYNPSFKKRR